MVINVCVIRRNAIRGHDICIQISLYIYKYIYIYIHISTDCADTSFHICIKFINENMRNFTHTNAGTHAHTRTHGAYLHLTKQYTHHDNFSSRTHSMFLGKNLLSWRTHITYHIFYIFYLSLYICIYIWFLHLLGYWPLLQYIPRNMHTVFALLCFVVVIHWLIVPYPSGLLHWHCGDLTIAPVPAKQPWWIWINTSCEFIMNDCITTTKQSTTKPCAYFLGYTVYGILFPNKWLLFGTAINITKLDGQNRKSRIPFTPTAGCLNAFPGIIKTRIIWLYESS